jgi:hypothetical protein
MLFPELEERLRRAKLALDGATSEHIIELCRQHLALLAEYHAELYKLPDRLGINQWSGTCLWEDVSNVRKAIRAAIEQTTRERHGTEARLLSFTSLSGYEAAETLLCAPSTIDADHLCAMRHTSDILAPDNSSLDSWIEFP